MKDFTDKFMLVFYGLFGAGLGFLIYLFAPGGWELCIHRSFSFHKTVERPRGYGHPLRSRRRVGSGVLPL